MPEPANELHRLRRIVFHFTTDVEEARMPDAGWDLNSVDKFTDDDFDVAATYRNAVKEIDPETYAKFDAAWAVLI